jgi:ATP-binding cassette subfamily B protein
MPILYRYLKQYFPQVLLALLLATINQVFSLLDPLIFRHVIDNYATKYQQYTTEQFFRGVSLLLGATVGVAFVSRVAKNFQDYVINRITQQLGAQMYADGIRHSLSLPYQVFEDQRSGETLGKLQKVRTDVEKFIQICINLLFSTLVGVVFVMIYAFNVHWAIAPAFFLTIPLLGTLSSVLSKRIKKSRAKSSRKQQPSPAPPPRASATSNWSNPWASPNRKSSASTPPPEPSSSWN